MGALDKVKEIEKMKQDYQARLEREAKSVVGEVFAEFFAANPTVKSVVWQQYTPFFNDGDACEFGVYDFYYLLEGDSYTGDNGNEEDETGKEGYRSAYVYGSQGNPNETIAVNNLRKVLPEDVLLVAFGDHRTIVATKSGFEVQEYDHE